MTNQPIPPQIAEKDSSTLGKFNTLLVDGSNVLFYSLFGDHSLSSVGIPIGGAFQFLLQLKILLKHYDFRYVYVFWDGDHSGQLRHDIYPEYKATREKSYEESNQSEYMKNVNAKIRELRNYVNKKQQSRGSVEYKENRQKLLFYQREIIMEVLEELFIRQCMCDYTEADDFIGYYVTHKQPNERIVILSNDRDIAQLIASDVIVYVQQMKRFINSTNCCKYLGCHPLNIKLLKIVCGDRSDNIKGIEKLGPKGLLKAFPELKTKPYTVQELLKKVQVLKEERIKEGKKPYLWMNNLEKRKTLGSQGTKVLEINEKIVDLHNPLMPDEAKELLDDMMYAPLDAEGRSMEKLYKLMVKYDIDILTNEKAFSTFFSDFVKIINREKKKSLSS